MKRCIAMFIIACMTIMLFGNVVPVFAEAQLEAPTGLVFADGANKKLTWMPVENASGYIVNIYDSQGELHATAETKIPLYNDVNMLIKVPGTYDVGVVAVGEGYANSVESDKLPISFTYANLALGGSIYDIADPATDLTVLKDTGL